MLKIFKLKKYVLEKFHNLICGQIYCKRLNPKCRVSGNAKHGTNVTQSVLRQNVIQNKT